MSYYITITTSLEKKSFNRDILGDYDILNIDEKIEEEKEFLNKIKEELLVFANIDKKLLINEEDEEPDIVFVIRNKFDELLETYTEIIIDLEILKDIKDLLNYDRVAIYDELSDKFYVKKEYENIIGYFEGDYKYNTEKVKHYGLVEVSEKEYNEYIEKLN